MFCLEILTLHCEGFELPNMSGYILETSKECIFIKQRTNVLLEKETSSLCFPIYRTFFTIIVIILMIMILLKVEEIKTRTIIIITIPMWP